MNSIWIEIPVSDLTRAKTFYEAVFQYAPTEISEADGRTITIIEGTPSVSLNQTPGFTPTPDGSLPYFHVDGSAVDASHRVTSNGGRVLAAPTARGDLGMFTLVADSEGNALYVHTGS